MTSRRTLWFLALAATAIGGGYIALTGFSAERPGRGSPAEDVGNHLDSSSGGASAAGPTSSHSDGELVSEHTQNTASRVRAHSSRAVTGQVQQERGGIVSGVAVSLLEEGEVVSRSKSDEDGRFSLLLPVGIEGKAQVLVSPRPPFAPRQVPIRVGGSANVDAGVIMIRGGVVLAGVVLSETGQVIKGAKVSLRNAAECDFVPSVKTDSSGQFRMGPIPIGRGMLKVEHDDYVVGKSRSFNFDRAAEVFLGEIRLKVGRQLEVTVSDSQQRPIDGAVVRLEFKSKAALQHMRRTNPSMRTSTKATTDLYWVCQNARFPEKKTGQRGRVSFSGVPKIPGEIHIEVGGQASRVEVSAAQTSVTAVIR